ncbi:CyaY protein [Sulfuritortus calidifontis]|uniref:Iron-sulfur cluster assembly protein CyaY n=1 Tax=Sulfuritortus calidifontis TaxID=1914471 RepID=A0A4R3JXX1_9PROT|nr:iron donor protein CyaY [Sulfuritortus calidifontis]TCS73359.1 CyaY protein [Sulfuritortus calidifontis]
MDEREYQTQADAVLARIEEGVEGSGAEVECERAGSGILELEFDDGSKIVINKQAAVQEIWVAARSGGFHYRWQDGQWRDTRTGEELFAALSRLASEQAGAPVNLA